MMTASETLIDAGYSPVQTTQGTRWQQPDGDELVTAEEALAELEDAPNA
jgi:hypothetical protein